MTPEISPLTIDDYDQIIELWNAAGLPTRPQGRESRQAFARELALDHVAVFGLWVGDRLAGVSIANWDGRRGWINRMAVHPDYRGLGFAGLLFKPCEDFLKDKGALVIAALVDDINYPSITAFQKEGLQAIEGIIYLSKYAFEGA
jgi:GNAT superfamily N-acetyltransferase